MAGSAKTTELSLDGFKFRLSLNTDNANRHKVEVEVVDGDGELLGGPDSYWVQDGRVSGKHNGVSANHFNTDAGGFITE